MKAAAAVLGASLLFFLGVLTGVGRREAVRPPTAIALGVEAPRPAGDAPPATGATSPPRSPSTTAPRSQLPNGASPTTVSTVTTSTTVAPTRNGQPPGTTSTTFASPSSTTATTAAPAGPGRVEQVGGQVDCSPSGKRGKGKRQPCEPTTTSTAPGTESGGRNNR